MPSLIGSTVAANYRKQQVPFSRFGTREIGWYKIGRADDQQSPGVLDQVAFNTIIDTIQTKAEVVIVGAPYISNSWGKFMVAVFEDTFNNGSINDISGTTGPGSGNNGNSETLQDALRAALNDSNIVVQRLYLAGAPETGHTGYDGWSTEEQYKEYTYKADYEANSYVF